VAERRIPVACVQTQAVDRTGFQEAWPRFLALVDSAGTSGAKLIVLPEGTVPSYVVGTTPVPPELIQRTESDLAELAKRHGAVLVYGTARIHEGRQFNSASVIGPDGRDLGFAAKQFLWHFDRKWFEPGRTLDPIDTPLGRLGVLVCADNRIPTIPSTLVERGAELLVMPTAWVTSGRDPGNLENAQADIMINVRAHENGVPFIACNKAGIEEQSVAYCGKSAIVSADGHLMAQAGESEETVLLGEVEVGTRPQRSHATLGATLDENFKPLEKMRIAFTLETDPAKLERYRKLAELEDAGVLISPEDGPARIIERDGLRYGVIGTNTFCNPRGLVEARLAGVDLFVWDLHAKAAWRVSYGRTRAMELRAWMIGLDREQDRAAVIDPDGVVIAGTFGDLKVAAFSYDRSRSANGLVAPFTDAFAGLRNAEAIRARGMEQSLVAPRG